MKYSDEAVKAYPVADVGSNHSSVLTKSNLRLKRIIVSNKQKKNINVDMEFLKESDISNKVREEVNSSVENTNGINSNDKESINQ